MKYAADIPALANASQRRRYRGNCPWFLAMWRGFESVPNSAQHLALSLAIEWYRPEALTTSSTAAPVTFLGQLMPAQAAYRMQVLIVCESPCIRSAHAKNRYFWLRHMGSRFLAKPMPAKSIVAGAMRERLVGSPPIALACSLLRLTQPRLGQRRPLSPLLKLSSTIPVSNI